MWTGLGVFGQYLYICIFVITRNIYFVFLCYSVLFTTAVVAWVRCIFIVVAKGDKQVPAWFNADQNRVVIVRHQEIFKDPKALPTYNSHAIEANLYNIKGLARFFLSVNHPNISLSLSHTHTHTHTHARARARIACAISMPIHHHQWINPD